MNTYTKKVSYEYIYKKGLEYDDLTLDSKI